MLTETLFAVTNAIFASLHGLSVGPFTRSTIPVPLRKARARHERHGLAASAAGFRLRLGSGVALADRRPKPRQDWRPLESVKKF
jgi:hypothetical protein